MNDLAHCLRQTEDAFLRMIAGIWQLNAAPNVDHQELCEAVHARMSDREISRQMLASLPADTLSALSFLKNNSGSAEALTFINTYGPIRSTGTARMLREELWKNPVSPAEDLLFHGIIFRESVRTDKGITERYTVPEDFFRLIAGYIPDAKSSPVRSAFVIRPALPAETAYIESGSEAIQDLACCLLAFIRQGESIPTEKFSYPLPMIRFTQRLLECSGIIPESPTADTEKLRLFLIGDRQDIQQSLFNTYAGSPDYSELEEDQDDFFLKEQLDYRPEAARRCLLQCLQGLKSGTWWSMNGLLSAVEREMPDFLSDTFKDPTWNIWDSEKRSLKGLGSWHRLEGAYIRFILSGPLSYLGLVDLARETKEKSGWDAFRLRPGGKRLLAAFFSGDSGQDQKLRPETGIPGIESDGKITCLHTVSRMFRYQAARYCDLEITQPHRTIFRITPSSLERARSNGLEVEGFLTLLKRVGKDHVPPILMQTLRNWTRSGTTAVIFDAVLLSVPDQAQIDELLSNERTAKWVLQQLNRTTLLIDRQGRETIRRFLMEHGVFTEIE